MLLRSEQEDGVSNEQMKKEQMKIMVAQDVMCAAHTCEEHISASCEVGH